MLRTCSLFGVDQINNYDISVVSIHDISCLFLAKGGDSKKTVLPQEEETCIIDMLLSDIRKGFKLKKSSPRPERSLSNPGKKDKKVLDGTEDSKSEGNEEVSENEKNLKIGVVKQHVTSQPQIMTIPEELDSKPEIDKTAESEEKPADDPLQTAVKLNIPNGGKAEHNDNEPPFVGGKCKNNCSLVNKLAEGSGNGCEISKQNGIETADVKLDILQNFENEESQCNSQKVQNDSSPSKSEPSDEDILLAVDSGFVSTEDGQITTSGETSPRSDTLTTSSETSPREAEHHMQLFNATPDSESIKTSNNADQESENKDSVQIKKETCDYSSSENKCNTSGQGSTAVAKASESDC